MGIEINRMIHQKIVQKNILKDKKTNFRMLIIALGLVILLGLGTYVYNNSYKNEQNSNLGTYNDPQVAFSETKKALNLLSSHLKIGIESVQYIEEYDNSKNLIFKESKSKSK